MYKCRQHVIPAQILVFGGQSRSNELERYIGTKIAIATRNGDGMHSPSARGSVRQAMSGTDPASKRSDL